MTEAVRIGLADLLVPTRPRCAAPLPRPWPRKSPQIGALGGGLDPRNDAPRLVEAAEAATERELVEQDWLRRTGDFSEGIKAMADRRLPEFKGR